MTNASQVLPDKRRLLSLLATIPAGYVTTHADIASHLAIQHRHVGHLLATLDEAELQQVPWWRVVADGGAIGRHPRREAQMNALRRDGVPLSPVGIVQEFKDRRVPDLASPPTTPLAHATPASSAAPSRSRGMKSHPGA